jgi:hypothetical protein
MQGKIKLCPPSPILFRCAQFISVLMKQLLGLLVLVFLYFSEEKSDKDTCFDYPQRINEPSSRDFYDSARWILYNWLGPKKIDGIYYGQMELRFRDVLSRNDTIEIFFQFYAPDSLSAEKKKSTLVARASVAFRQDTKKRLWAFVYPFEDFSDGLEPGDKYLESPPSDTAIKFLKLRKYIINDCYLQLARKRLVLD